MDISLRNAAIASDAQINLMKDGWDWVSDMPAVGRGVMADKFQYLSRTKDKLRKEYDEVIPFSLSPDLGRLLSQLDLSP